MQVGLRRHVRHPQGRQLPLGCQGSAAGVPQLLLLPVQRTANRVRKSVVGLKLCLRQVWLTLMGCSGLVLTAV